MKNKYVLLVIACSTSFVYAKGVLSGYTVEDNKTELRISNKDVQYIKKSVYKNEIINRIKNYSDMVKDSKNLAKIKKINRVNIYFNKFTYKKDILNYSKKDYWATRKEFIFKGSGDCEDYAIGKYFTLLELDIPKDAIALYYARYKNNPHLVVLYKSNNTNYVLDNINHLVLPIAQRPNLKLLYKVDRIKESKFELFSKNDFKK